MISERESGERTRFRHEAMDKHGRLMRASPLDAPTLRHALLSSHVTDVHRAFFNCSRVPPFKLILEKRFHVFSFFFFRCRSDFATAISIVRNHRTGEPIKIDHSNC